MPLALACGITRPCRACCTGPRPYRYEAKAAAKAARLAEQDRLEQQAAAEAESQRQRQEARHKRRALREVLQWVKVAARTPAEVQNR
jgi:hypothetical protein